MKNMDKGLTVPKWMLINWPQIKFSKKARKIDEIFTFNFTLCSRRQIDGEDFINFCGLL